MQLFTLPVLLWFYGEVSLAGILLNLLVLPTVGVVLACGAAGILAGLVCLPLAWFIVLPGRILLIVYEKLCALAGRLPLCTWIGGVPKVWQIVIYYGLLGAALFVLWKLEKKKEEKKQRGKILIKAVCLFAIRQPENNLSGCGAGGRDCRGDAGGILLFSGWGKQQ